MPVDIATGKAGRPIMTGARPEAIVMAPDGRTVYVVSWMAGTVTPVEVATNTAGPPVKVGANPSAMVIVP